MLLGHPTKKGTGFILLGDYYDLRNLYDTISEISDSIVLQGPLSDYLLGLNYDIRHAYENRRENIQLGLDEISGVKYYGIKMLWPCFIIQLGLLRWAASFIPTNNEHQSNLYRLESIVEKTLRETSPLIADDCLFWLKHFHGFKKDYLVQYLNDITYRFIFDESLHKKRINRLPMVLHMTFELSPEYKSYETLIMKIAKEKGCAPTELVNLDEWPDFTW